ncbi:NAD+ synthase [Thermoleptolyngbya sp. M55_K2018_002]|uniref:NAD+ synthase n=1 Tax=Thermoleptolyngbya sp. M55_K2018_002 TaxID=2747808 RepID=UPI001A1038B6|nr:NAD+ synthase [Thermoleptolyngbya sp. M55_K2018_002]HIK42843.1 NAD+ synthase [Thermoleptolyngbya sp. M55_K2018_002]
MKIAIAQLNPTIGDLAGNARQILEAAQTASAAGARLLLTTELSLCGYPPRDLLMQPNFLTRMAETLAQLATDLPADLAVLVGTVLPNPDAVYDGEKPLFNTTALLLDGTVQRYFHKRLLPTYDVFDEDRYFEPGEESSAFELDGVWIGVTICEDLWNDESFWGKRHYEVNPIAELTRQGVDLVLNLSASPYSVGKQHLRENMLRHSATRYGQPILYANQVGGNDDLLFDGCSFGLNRAGELVVRAKAFERDLVFAAFDPAVGELMPLPDAVAPLPDCAEAEIWMALVMGVRDYGRKCGFSKAVLGLSGGIDSALVAAIATAALGPENVLGVLMPSPYSSDHSITDALDLAKNLGIQTQTLPIAPIMQGFDHALADLFAGTEFGIAEENLQSRIRGTLLMAISNKFGHLLISTGNKSEMAVGYCTLYGDMNGGLGAIADVPKTRVYSICQWLNQENRAAFDSSLLLKSATQPVIPPHIITKPPSAELKPGQVDQDSLPPYDVLDDILERFVEHHQAPADIVAAGHDAAVVNQVIRLVTRAEFKRKQAAPGLKITDRAFGTGWRMPIASRWLPSVQPKIPQPVV